MPKNVRPKGYNYLEILKDHLGDLGRVFSGELIYPRQIEIHLPSDHKNPCNFSCFYCQGKLLSRTLGFWEMKALRLMNELSGKIPYYVFGGAYSEPTMNPYMMTFLHTAKDCGAFFGIHTNGSMLKVLEKNQGWLTELCRIATDKQDYLSVSLDAGTPHSHTRTKGLIGDYFSDIIEGIRLAVMLRGKKEYPTIRVCYLLNDLNSSQEEVAGMIKLAKELGVDSLRFSIPYALYGQDFEKVRKYKQNVELKQNKEYEERLRPLMSESVAERPYIFYHSPQYQDVDEMTFKQCIYSYYQITLAADGYVYKCSCTSSPSFKGHQLGKITDNLEEFDKMVLSNHNPNWNARSRCWAKGARCNRMALEINKAWRDK